MVTIAKSDHEVLTEVPDTLKRLVRCIMRGFYSIEHALVMDQLIHHPCIREDDLCELMKLDRKYIRTLLNTLRTEKFVKTRMRVETDGEGKTTRVNYYFIAYMTFVNVVKYKLDHMRRKIETEERDSTSRSAFNCPACLKTFTDLEADRLLDFATGTMLCDHCKAEVEMSNSAQEGQDARTLMVKFNEQMEPVFGMLKASDDVKLAPELLEPEPSELRIAQSKSYSKRGGEHGLWSGSATKGKNYFGTIENQVTVSVTDSAVEAPKAQKERPIWLVESTVEGSGSDNVSAAAGAAGAGDADLAAPQTDNDIMRTLLMHEKKSNKPVLAGIPAALPSGGETSSSESEDETMKTLLPSSREQGDLDEAEDMESEEEEEASVLVAGRRYLYHEVTPALVSAMTAAEKDEYIRVGQEMYQNMYD